MTAIYFEQRGTVYTVRFRYDPTLVEMIKAVVPSFARSWNQQRREWTVEDIYAKPLADALRRIGHTIIGLEPPQPQRHDDHRWAHALFQRVGRDRADQVYRALSRCLHPDVGGDTELQRELNQAHAELRKESA